MSEPLLDAGLLPVGTPADNADTVRARRYRHPALGDRAVVRLTGDAVAPGEDRALAFLGFEEPVTSEPLARGRRRGLGYPAWALVNDPERAADALAAVPEMERAARRARTKPGLAADEFARIARRLPEPHLPSYWEQAGRAFIAAGSPSQAATMFGRAREVEQVYALPVDEVTRRDAYLEFTFAGAITVKALAAHVAELSDRYAPDQAYEEYLELALRRTLGGLPPWTELPRQLRQLAKAAGRDLAAEDARCIDALLGLPALRHAHRARWRG